MLEFKLPSLGADMDEGKLLQWNVVPGQAVQKGDVIAVVDTSKAAVDVEIWFDGTVQQLVTEVGQTIPVGTVMALLLAPGERAPADSESVRPAAPAAVPLPVAPAAPATSAAALPVAPPVRRRVSPAARQRAAELGVDLERIAGTGAGGAVTREDVERAATGFAAENVPPDRTTAMRRAIGAAMSRSKREIPHYYLAETVPMRKALEWLRAANEQRPVTERLLPAVLLLKAVAVAVRDVPEMNGLFLDGAFRPSQAAHVGVAISLRQGGLIAPALHDAGSRTLAELMRDLADLVRRCRSGSLRSSEMADPTITVTNLGEQGVADVFGVIYPPQVALVGVGRIVEQPWIEDGRVTATPLLRATLSADHRVSDGHRGAQFLARLRDLLQQPQTL
jgi:pyruvate dehydrogenase E2 component (dihydrolipoamide acetyltransferase)